MAFSWLSVFLLATTVVLVTSEYNADICRFPIQSCGPITPPVPRNFEMKFEYADNEGKRVTYSELYLDYTNYRGKYMYLSQGIEYHTLFDYDTEQIIQWKHIQPGLDIKVDPLSHTCAAKNILDVDEKYIFGYVDEFSNRPKMYTSNEMLRYGGRYIYAFNKSDTIPDRGLLVNKFKGCVYEEYMDVTMAIDYYFSSDKVMPSAGSSLTPVTGQTFGLLSIPLKANYFTEGKDPLDQAKTFKVNTTENIFWFKAEPEFHRETFKIPPYTYCSKYLGRKPVYKFPQAFDSRIEITKMARALWGKMVVGEIVSYEEVFYYKDRGLARRDFTPDPDLDTEIIQKFQNNDPVKTVYDFNEGVLYVTHKHSGRCYARKINFGDFFENSNNTMYISMKNPEELFQMHTDEMQYKGTDFVRGIECDVYTGKYYDKQYQANFVKETYISTNGWHEESNQKLEYSVPVKHVILNGDLMEELVEGVAAYNFLKFMNMPPPIIDFDIGNCIETQDHKDFAVLLSVEDDVEKILFDYKNDFVEASQYYIADAIAIGSPLRVQRLQLTQLSVDDTRPFLHFTLVNRTKIKTDTPFAQKGLSLSEAERKLNAYVNAGNFTIPFNTPATKNFIPVEVKPGGLYVKTASGKLESPDFYDPEYEISSDDKPFFDVSNDEDDVEVKKGMSPGGLAGLSFAMLFIGLGIGIAVMYLYIRKYSEDNVDSGLGMTQRN